ncbi:MAG: cytochrome c [Nitrospiraceae bacterium]
MAIVHRYRRPVRSTFMILAASLLVWLVGSSSAQEFPADVTRGKAVYERHCVSCHGISGGGDGPEARSLTVPPANFHRFSSYLKSDEQLQRTIEYGVVFSPMHSWQGQLTETEIRDVLEYIRLLSRQSR